MRIGRPLVKHKRRNARSTDYSSSVKVATRKTLEKTRSNAQLRGTYEGHVGVERHVAPPRVRTACRMNIICSRDDQQLVIDVVVATCATTNQAELSRRHVDASRAIRAAQRRKRQRYGDNVLPVVVEDSGRIGSGTRRLSRELAECREDTPTEQVLNSLLAKVQAIVLGATAAMMQKARGVQPTPA